MLLSHCLLSFIVLFVFFSFFSYILTFPHLSSSSSYNPLQVRTLCHASPCATGSISTFRYPPTPTAAATVRAIFGLTAHPHRGPATLLHVARCSLQVCLRICCICSAAAGRKFIVSTRLFFIFAAHLPKLKEAMSACQANAKGAHRGGTGGKGNRLAIVN